MSRITKQSKAAVEKDDAAPVDELEQVDIEETPGAVEDDDLVDDSKPSAEDAAADLKKQLKEKDLEIARERGARQEAERIANENAGRANDSVTQQIATQKQAIASKVTAATDKLAAAKQQLKQAKLAGDSEAEVELQDAMAEARYELNAANWEQNNFARWEEANKVKKPATAGGGNATTDHQFTAAEQVWIDAHPEYKANKTFARIANSAASEALHTMKLKQDSTEFFAYIEDALKESGHISEEGDPLSEAGKTNKSTSTSTATPPNRTGNGAAPPVRPNAKYPYLTPGFKIPAEWVEAAKDQGFDDPREYANDRLKIAAEEKSNV